MPKRPCPCEGHTLDRLLQPTVMALLSRAPMHGYSLAERIRDTPMMRGKRPDRTGLYRILSQLEEQRLVRHTLEDSNIGPSKRMYELTPAGRVCVKKWLKTIDAYGHSVVALSEYMKLIVEER